MDWSVLAPDKTSPVPLYHQLAEAIRERVRSGTLPPGEQLPPERELAERVGISRMTARQALAELTRDGALEVRHGVGTFVAAPKLTYDALHLLGFTEATLQHGDAARSRVLEQALLLPPPGVAAGLGLLPFEQAVKIVRLRCVGDTPVLLETSYLPAARVPGLDAADLETRSLYALLERHYGLRLRRARQTVEATVATDYERDLFGVPAAAPMLLLEGITYDDEDRPVESFKAIYRADRLKFALESRRESVGEANASPLMSVVLI